MRELIPVGLLADLRLLLGEETRVVRDAITLRRVGVVGAAKPGVFVLVEAGDDVDLVLFLVLKRDRQVFRNDPAVDDRLTAAEAHRPDLVCRFGTQLGKPGQRGRGCWRCWCRGRSLRWGSSRRAAAPLSTAPRAASSRSSRGFGGGSRSHLADGQTHPVAALG